MKHVSQSKRSTILYVDDDADIQAIAKIALESLGPFIVTLCSSGKDAIGIVKYQQFDSIMLDVMMPSRQDQRHSWRCVRAAGTYLPSSLSPQRFKMTSASTTNPWAAPRSSPSPLIHFCCISWWKGHCRNQNDKTLKQKSKVKS